MIRYIITKELEVDESVYESEVVGILDAEEEARQTAENLYNEMPDYEQQYYEVIVWSVSEDSLEVPGDWESFTDCEEVVTFSAEPEGYEYRWREMDDCLPECDPDYVVHFCVAPMQDGVRVWIGDDADKYVDHVIHELPIDMTVALEAWFTKYGEYAEENWKECFPEKMRRRYLRRIASLGKSAEEALEILQYLPQTCSELVDDNIAKMIELWERKAPVIVPYRTPLWKKMVLREHPDLWAKDVRSPRAECAWKEG